MAKSYYKTIKGKKYDRELLELAEERSKSHTSGKLTINDSKELIESALDGNIYTEIEQATILYILENFPFTPAAKDKLQILHKQNTTSPAKKKTPPNKPTSKTRKATTGKPSLSAPLPIVTEKQSIDKQALKEELYTEILFEIKKEVRDEWQNQQKDQKDAIKKEVLLQLPPLPTPTPSSPAFSVDKLKEEIKQEIKAELKQELMQAFEERISKMKGQEHSHRWIYLSIFALFLFVLFNWLYLLCHTNTDHQKVTQTTQTQPQNQLANSKTAVPRLHSEDNAAIIEPTAPDSDPTPKNSDSPPNRDSDKALIESLQIKFGKNSYQVQGEESTRSIRLISDSLKKHKNWKIRIIGHTCNLGNTDFNQKISKFRAQAIGNYLKNSGVADEQVEVFGKGQVEPKFDNTTATGQEKNRRVEFKILER
ncbi:MAG: OmpA family protein [Spirochaetota bacterium]